ncbi:hypothetical protein [Chryseobacterium sp. BIGb0232]|uniref:hypothetical protein n=1 Tax=Chryseobacterium sp. BIGb0232 TaxID=2940598 RepID=UPI000F46EB39|nr:hypothetical protein [Chryseobacterium sp. BIGb0232]MCS4303308.1 hypothetical protein [Chryseobacterium sp. BIGb0232]ROS11418.1 hypothetical protein EDF65_3830 [Chryseobacterium nakagawai]
MKPLLLFFVIILSNFSIKNLENKCSDNDLIIEKIIDYNHLKAKKTDVTQDKISSTLIKIEINFNTIDQNDFEKYFLPIGADGKPDASAKKFLFREDYKDFLSQYNENKITEISKTIQKKYRNLKLSEIEQDKKNHINYKYLEFSKVFFSHDRQTAYIEANYHDGVYGDGTAFILRKNNTAWEIVQIINIWIT